MSDYMPEELFVKILAYLPPKSLVRFTCVCKSWHFLITSSDFITTHLNQTRISNDRDGNHLILLRRYPGHPAKDRHSLRIDNDTFHEYDVSEFPIKSRHNQYFRILGSFNGLICLSDDFLAIVNTVVLWNPSIRKCLTLPRPDFTYETHGPYDQAIGFGFDSRTNEYKVVRIVRLQSEEDESPRVQLYKLSTGSWETITATIDPLCVSIYYKFGTQAFVNGAVHWPAFKRGADSLIISFDMSKEVFHEIMLPTSAANLHWVINLPLAVCGEWLSFFDVGTESYNFTSIWVMKDYGVVESWTKLYTFVLYEGVGKMLGFRRNGELLLAMMNRELVSYDPETQKIKHLGVCDSDKHSRPHDIRSYSFHVENYVESLVLLGMQTDCRKVRDDSKEENEDDACDESEEENSEDACDESKEENEDDSCDESEEENREDECYESEEDYASDESEEEMEE